MEIKSNIRSLALERGIKNPQELSYDARVSWPTAKQLWVGRIQNQRLETLIKVSCALDCPLDYLYEVV